jgi:hypothetical protein
MRYLEIKLYWFPNEALVCYNAHGTHSRTHNQFGACCSIFVIRPYIQACPSVFRRLALHSYAQLLNSLCPLFQPELTLIFSAVFYVSF